MTRKISTSGSKSSLPSPRSISRFAATLWGDADPTKDKVPLDSKDNPGSED